MQAKPEPFLRRPFTDKVKPIITEGWYYSNEEVGLHGVKLHQSVDFAMPIGTPVLASADGLAVASFTEVPVLEKDGSQRQWQGRPIFFGAGLVIKIFHPNGWCTIYGHLHALVPEFIDAQVYYPPLEQGHDLVSQNIRIPTSDVGSKVKALPVKAGQLIAFSGITGMGWGQKTYTNWLAGKPYDVCDEEHLHFQVLYNEITDKVDYQSIDPFGIYKQHQFYPNTDEDWSQLDDTLWMS